jgi:lysophospholipase L1-like esterase
MSMLRSSRGRRWLLGLLVSLSTVVALGLGEILHRAAAWARYRAQVAAFVDPMFELRADRDYVYVLRRGLDQPVTIADPAGGPPTQCRYTTNQDRLRTHAEWPPSRAPGMQRVLCIGDSYTFGLGVQDGEAWPHVVERTLRARGVQVAAINAGVPGYNSEQEAAWLDELLPAYAPSAVVVAYIMNDTQPVTIAPVPPSRIYRGCASWLLEDGKAVVDLFGRLCIDDRPLCRSHKPTLTFDYESDYRPDAAWDGARAALGHMQARCAAAGVPLLVVVMPDFTQPFGDDYRFHGIHERVVTAAAAAGSRTLDLLPAFAGRDARALRVRGDGHPDAEGQRLLGEGIAPAVAALLGHG